jgi:hypothetical protein
MSTLDSLFDSDKTTRSIPCEVHYTMSLRTAAQDCRPEIGRVKVDPARKCVRAYTFEEDTVYVFDCSKREGDPAHSIAEILIGLGRYASPAINVPDYLTQGTIAYWLEPA